MRRLALPALLAALLSGCGDDAEVAPVVSLDGSATDAAPDAGEVPEPGDVPEPEDVEDVPIAVDPGKPKDLGPDVPTGAEPRVVALTVTAGPTSGGTDTVVLTVGFQVDFTADVPLVSFGGQQAALVKPLSHGIVKVTTPPGATGPVKVAVKAGGQTASLVDAFTYTDDIPADHVVISLGGGVEPNGLQLPIPITLKVVGGAKPAALFLHVKHDPLILPLAAPTPLAGDVAEKAGKQLVIHTKKPDGVRVLLLGKNRDVLGSGTVATFVFPVPPAPEKWAVSPLTVIAKAVDPYGVDIPVITEYGWLGVAP